MNATETATHIPEEIKDELRQTLDDLVKGVRRPDKMKAACERMDRMREENRKLFGEQENGDSFRKLVADKGFR